MSVSLFDSAIHGGLVSDEDAMTHLSDDASIAAMIRVEAALARAEADTGVIPADAGRALAASLEVIAKSGSVRPGDLAAGASASAVAVPALVARLREQLDPSLGQHLHWGATSQDIADTALMLRLRPLLAIIETRLEVASARLADLADAHRLTPCAARTWGQQAIPSSFGLACAVWLGSLTRMRGRLKEMRPRVLAVQFGGAVGNLSVLGRAGPVVRDALARDLDLAPAAPWHTQRDRIGEVASWCAGVAGAFGKVGADLSLMAMTEIGEVRLGASGGSSTMPQKQNPVGPQTLIALSRHCGAAAGAILQGAAHEFERDGAGWIGEWLSLSSVLASAAGAARLGSDTLEGLEANPDRMRANLEISGGGVLAEAASFALAAHMPRPDAQALVKLAARDDAPLIDALKARSSAPVDWAALGRWENHLGASGALIDQALAEAAALSRA